MSNQKFGYTCRFVFALLSFGSFWLCATIAYGQSQGQGFSIFESPSEDTAPSVSSQEAFTNPAVRLPKTQFGKFDSPSVESKPALQGSKAVGTYAQDGTNMFKKAPGESPFTEGKLKPFVVANDLRSASVPEPDETPEIKAVIPAPVAVSDFPNSTRRLTRNSTQLSAANAAPEVGKVAQVAFQDGGSFNPQPSSPGSSSRATTAAPTAPTNRFDFSAQSPNQTQPAASTFGQRNRNQRPAGRPTQQPPQRTNQGFGQQQPPARTQSQTPFNNASARSQPSRTQQPNRNQRTASPAQANRRAAASTQTNAKSAKELLTSWMKIDGQQKIPGKQVKFHEFLAQPINGSKKDAINQYWVTYTDLARHRLAVEQSQWLDSITKPRQRADQAIFEAAQQAAKNRVLHTEIQLAKSQSILGDYLPNLRGPNGKMVPVLPSNIPWVGKLNTKFDEYQSRGMVPARFGTIDDYLPKARQLIAGEAEAVIASAEAAKQAGSALKSGQTSVANLLEAVRIKERNEEEFLAAVLGYNRAITDYVLSVRQDIYQPKRLASVLIGRKAVQPTLASAPKPEEDFNQSSVGQLQQISTNSRTQRNNRLEGTSAYQNQNQSQNQRTARRGSTSSLSQNATSQSPFSQASTSQSASVPTQQASSSASFEYGPTADSAAAANFNPANLKEEMPMQQVKPASNADAYGSNEQRTARSSSTQPQINTVSSRGGGFSSPGAATGNRFGNPSGATGNSSFGNPSAATGNPAAARRTNPNVARAGANPAAAPRVGANPTGRPAASPAGVVGTNPTGRVGTSPTARTGVNPAARTGVNPAGRIGANPTARVGTSPTGRPAAPRFGAGANRAQGGGFNGRPAAPTAGSAPQIPTSPVGAPFGGAPAASGQPATGTFGGNSGGGSGSNGGGTFGGL